MKGSLGKTGWEALPDNVKSYASKFLSLSKTSTENILAMCEVLVEARTQLGMNEFGQLREAIGYGDELSDKTIIKYLQIGRYSEHFRPYLEKLPNTWTTLYEITQLPPQDFLNAVNNGLIHPTTRGIDVKQIKNPAQQSKEPPLRVSLLLSNDIDHQQLNQLLQELEILKMEFSYEVEVNSTAKKLQVME